jgi:hypothetical protein
MLTESGYPRIVDAACARLEIGFRLRSKQHEILVSAVRTACRVVGRELDLESVLAGIYGCELHESELKDERQIEPSTPQSIRSTEPAFWNGRYVFLEQCLLQIVREGDRLSRLDRCNMLTVFALIGHAIRTDLASAKVA